MDSLRSLAFDLTAIFLSSPRTVGSALIENLFYKGKYCSYLFTMKDGKDSGSEQWHSRLRGRYEMVDPRLKIQCSEIHFSP